VNHIPSATMNDSSFTSNCRSIKRLELVSFQFDFDPKWLTRTVRTGMERLSHLTLSDCDGVDRLLEN
jgi:hypothetical protein